MEKRPREVRILHVEDNKGDVVLAKAALSNLTIKYDLENITDGEEAHNFLFKRYKNKEVAAPDIILLDLDLPKKSGHEILADLKNDTELKHIPVIVLSGSQAKNDILRSYDNHANGYVNKPGDLDQYTELVDSLERFWFNNASLPTNYEH